MKPKYVAHVFGIINYIYGDDSGDDVEFPFPVPWPTYLWFCAVYLVIVKFIKSKNIQFLFFLLISINIPRSYPEFFFFNKKIFKKNLFSVSEPRNMISK